jgi:hypothetical protein
LALAAANQRQATGLDEEDGILTAEEIAALDLSGVEWAVLSACDTGIGEVKAGEGVLGLRRAKGQSLRIKTERSAIRARIYLVLQLRIIGFLVRWSSC